MLGIIVIILSRRVMKNLRDRDDFAWWMQISLALLVLSTSTSSRKLEEISSTAYDESHETHDQPDAVLINFPRRSNSSKSSRQLYLPSEEEQDFFLPEVIDNRVRLSNGDFRSTLKDTASLLTLKKPDVTIRGPSITSEKTFRNFPRNNLAPIKSLSSDLTGFTGISGISQIDQGPKEFANFYVQINSMSCQNSGEELFFRASMRPSRKLERPTIDGIVGDDCRVDRINDEYRINLANELFWNCGIQDCSTDRERYYCLNLRFPAISGLRLREDHKVTLRCKTQDKTASHTRRLNVKTLDTSGRNAPRIETGGYKNIFETEVGLYRKTFGSGHLFDAKIQPGGTVILGEEVLLRALVRQGDGWRYSRISDVTVHYVEKSQRSKIMNSLWILDGNGCLNPDVREICSREQYRVSPLENYLMFEAFMFDNMKMTDEMVMNVRITGCLDGSECALNCPAGHSRRARSLVDDNKKNETIDWSNDITFRVVLPDHVSTSSYEKSIDTHLVLPYVLSVIVLVTIVAMLATIKIFKRQRISKI